MLRYTGSMTRVGSACAIAIAAGVVSLFACTTDPPPSVTGSNDASAQLDGAHSADGGPATDPDAGASQGDAGEAGVPSYTVGGTISGYVGSGLSLETNGQTVAVPKAGSSFLFPTKLPAGTRYAVVAKTQPTVPSQTCTVEAGEGVVAGDVTNVAVTCGTNTYRVGVSVMGLTGSGLVLQNNGGDDLSVGPGTTGAFFPTKIVSGGPYNVTVGVQPNGQRCTVSSGTGSVVAGDVTTVAVNCVDNRYTIGGSVTGLAGTGLVLQNKAGADLPVNANGTFAFPTSELTGAAYQVTVKTQPTNRSQTCVVTDGTGNVAGANVTNIAISCTTNKFAISGTIVGLQGGGLQLIDKGPLFWNVPQAATSFIMPAAVLSGDTYNVTATYQPVGPTQNCVIANGSGTVGDSDVTNIVITCTTQSFNVKIEATGVAGPGITVTLNGTESLAVNANGTTMFPNKLLSGTDVEVVLTSQQNDATQGCGIVPWYPVRIEGKDLVWNVECGRKKISFISSVQFDGNLGGLAGADAKCGAVAAAAGLTGTFQASLGDGTTSAWDHVARSGGPWTLVDGTITCYHGTVMEGCSHPVDMTELGGPPPTMTSTCGPYEIFAGPATDANFKNAHCNNWTSASSPSGATYGTYKMLSYVGLAADCFSTRAVGCAGLSSLLCFER